MRIYLEEVQPEVKVCVQGQELKEVDLKGNERDQDSRMYTHSVYCKSTVCGQTTLQQSNLHK